MIRPFDIAKRDITLGGPNILTLLAGATSSVLGLMVLIGWHTQNTLLLQVLPGFVPMAYNTAMGFFISGVGLLLIALGKTRVGALLGSIVATLGLLTLVQYAFGIHLGIDQLFMTDFTFSQTASQTNQFVPGRMALNTATCFTLTGLALIIMATGPERFRQRALPLGVLGSLVIALAAVPFFGYLTGVANAYGWGALTRMAVHTAAGFMVVGAGIVAFAWQEDRAGRRGSPNWLPVLVGMGTLVATLLLWQALVSEQRTHTQRIVTSETAVIKSQIADRIGFRIAVLTRLAARWDIYGKPTKEKWEEDALLLIDPGTINRAAQWVDPSFHVRWIASADGNRDEEGRNLGADPQIRTALETARDQRKTVVTGGVSLADGSKGVMVTVPTFQGDRFDGFVIGVFETELLFNTLIGAEIARGYSVAIQSDGDEIYGNHAGNREYYAELHQEAEIALPGTTWRIDVWPRSGLVAESESPFPWVVLIAGMTMAVLLSLAMYLAQTARLRTRQAETTNLELDREIGERKQSEQALRASEERFRSVTQSVHDAIISADSSGTIIFWNKGARTIFGYKEEEVLGKSLTVLMPERYRDAHTGGMHRVSTTGETHVIGKTVELHGLRKDGTEFPLELSLSTWETAEGLFFTGIARDFTERMQKDAEIKQLNRDLERRVDERTAELQTTNQELEIEITERKRTEEALRESEEYFRLLVGGVKDYAIIMLDPEGRIASWNEGAKRIKGYEAEEIIGKHFSTFYPSKEIEAGQPEHELEVAITEGRFEEEGWRVRKDGSRFWANVVITAVRDEAGCLRGFSKVSRDITERKLAAERTLFLVEASTTLASSLDYEETLTRVARISVPQIADWCTVDIVDEDGHVQRVAMAHADPVREEMARDYLRRFPPKPDSDIGVSRVLRTLESVLVPEIDLSMLEASVKDSEQFEIIRKFQLTSAMIVPLVAHGRAVGAISLLTAESGRKYGPEDLVLAEEVARRAATAVENAQLYRQAEKARTEAEAIGEKLKKIVTELERSNTELQQFAYVASHDLQEPLRMVASYTQLLSRRYSGKLDESADEFIAYAVDGATRMQRLINDLLAYSRVSSQGKAFERTDGEAVLKQALANLQMALRESNTVVTHDPLPTVMGDDSQLTQLFQNLIGNAIKFHNDEPPAIHIGVERKANEWLICLRDNGIGMDSQYADRIFVIFQRLHSKEEYPGTGIGLSVCKKVVERHGGRIWVQSEPGEGSTFYFTIPVMGHEVRS